MHFEVKLRKNGALWMVSAPALDVMTQGKTRKEACLMLKDAVELLVDDSKFATQITKGSKSSEFYLTAQNSDKLIALLLRRQRQKHGLTLKQVAKRLGSNSVNSFARYEQGKASPTIGKFQELLAAIDPQLNTVLKFAT